MYTVFKSMDTCTVIGPAFNVVFGDDTATFAIEIQQLFIAELFHLQTLTGAAGGEQPRETLLGVARATTLPHERRHACVTNRREAR